MSKINETNYPRRPQSDYEDTDMLIIQEAGGNTYTTRIEDIREDCQETIAPTVEAVNDALAPPENGSTASQSYAIGEHFMRNGDFCTAIAAITSGASFTLNTNYVVGTIAEAIETLTSDLTTKLDKTSVINDLNQYTAGNALDAVQGRVLNEKLGGIYIKWGYDSVAGVNTLRFYKAADNTLIFRVASGKQINNNNSISDIT